MRWIEITVNATAESVDAVSNILVEEGCGGTILGDSTGGRPTNVIRVTGYFPAGDLVEARLNAINERVRNLPSLGLKLASNEVTVRWVDESEWVDAWKEHFKPVRVGRIVICPSWETFARQPDDVVVQLDPGMAFGTGHHETTQLCLQALQDCITGGETVLDVGTGSGILALAAAMLGARTVTGLEIDPLAAEAARANIENAGLSEKIEILNVDSPSAINQMADVVVANIVADVIIGLGGALYDATRPGGKLVVSGIILDREDEVSAQMAALGLKPARRRHSGEWAALEFDRIKDVDSDG